SICPGITLPFIPHDGRVDAGATDGASARVQAASCYLGISMTAARQELLRLLACKSFRRGDFKLSAGASSDYYVDCRTTTLDAQGARLTVQGVVEEIRAQGWEPVDSCVLTMGAF